MDIETLRAWCRPPRVYPIFLGFFLLVLTVSVSPGSSYYPAARFVCLFGILFFLALILFQFVYVRVVWFFKLQKGLGELLATLLFGSISTVVSTAIFQIESGAASFFVVAMVWSFAGSTWGWYRAETLKIMDARKRMSLLMRGWIAFPGLISAMAFILLIVMGMERGFSERWTVLIGYGLASFLLLPAARIEYRIWKDEVKKA